MLFYWLWFSKDPTFITGICYWWIHWFKIFKIIWQVLYHITFVIFIYREHHFFNFIYKTLCKFYLTWIFRFKSSMALNNSIPKYFWVEALSKQFLSISCKFIFIFIYKFPSKWLKKHFDYGYIFRRNLVICHIICKLSQVSIKIFRKFINKFFNLIFWWFYQILIFIKRVY